MAALRRAWSSFRYAGAHRALPSTPWRRFDGGA